MSACVSKSKHEKQMSELNQELSQTQEAIAKAKAENAALEAERNKIQDNLVATTKDRGQLKASLD
jgi:hypothetical protein